MTNKQIVKVAAVQASPIVFDIDACLDKAAQLTSQAKAQQCDLIAFGEAWFPGYPFQIWLGAPAWYLQYTTQYFENSVELGSPEFDRLRSIARDNKIFISAGISERAGGSLYLSQCLIDGDGEVLSLRRKLKPTHAERSIFGEGYGQDLEVVATDLGNVGQLCCWEHIQPLSKYAMYSQNEQIHITAWPSFVLYREKAHALGKDMSMSISRVYAVEGQCFVVAASSVVNQQMLDFFKVGTEVPPFLELGGGSSMIFGPDGRELASYIPEQEEGLVIAELNFDEIIMAKALADPAGHYSKPESTRLLLNKTPMMPVVQNKNVDDQFEEPGMEPADAANKAAP